MPSEPRARLEWLWSQGLGVVCGQLAVLLLAIGSVVLVATKDSASAGVSGDDITEFFAYPSRWHLWLYLLLAVLALYGINTALCTLRSVTRKWRAGVRSLGGYGPSVMHVGFLVGLIAHLVGGLGGVERGSMQLGGAWTALPEGWSGTSARVEALHTVAHPDGSAKSVRAIVELRDADGHERTEELGYNMPLSTGWGTEILLLANEGLLEVAVLEDGERTCRVAPGTPCRLSQQTVMIEQVLAEGGHWGSDPVLIVQTRGGQRSFLKQGRPQPMPSGPPVTFVDVVREPTVILRGRHSPGSPSMALSVALMCLGILMLGRRWLPPHARA